MATTQTTQQLVWSRGTAAPRALSAQTSAAQAALTFLFNTSHQLRVVVRGEEPWFVASDLAKALGYRDAANMARAIDGDDKGTHNVSTPSGDQQMTIVNESGLYCAIFASRRPESRQFKRWVTSEVLPSIRRGGQYSLQLGLATTAKLAFDPQPEPRPRPITQSEYASLAELTEKISLCYSLPGVGRFAAWRVAREAAGIGRGSIKTMQASALKAVRARLTEFLAESKRLKDATLLAERTLAARYPGAPRVEAPDDVWTPERVSAWLQADRLQR